MSAALTRDVSAPARWRRAKRAILDMHPSLCGFARLRRWAGGRWARFALVVAASPLAEMEAWSQAWAAGDLAQHEDDTSTRWRPVDACPCSLPSACVCEVWP